MEYPATSRPVDRFHSLLTSFAGIPAGQVWADYVLWEELLNAHPAVKGIVEIGTWKGGFSRYLHAQAQTRGLTFTTFDAVPPTNPPPGFERLDVFARPERISSLLEDLGTFALLCDGGNKARELRLFAPYVKENSIVIVHDWLTEVGPADVPACLRELHGDYCDQLGSMSRVFEARS